jgi:Cu(I)/Ag(I) efflux system membrane fusion protein
MRGADEAPHGERSEEMRKGTVIAGVLLASGLPIIVGAAGASEFDRAMEPVLAEYLKIQTALAADETDGVEDAVHAIQDLAKKIDTKTASGEHAEHYQNIPEDISVACGKFHEAKDIGSIREAFRDLSKPVSMWVTMAEPKDTSVMYCPMAKAGWVQHGSEVANPYFGSEMLSCGEKVGGAD